MKKKSPFVDRAPSSFLSSRVYDPSEILLHLPFVDDQNEEKKRTSSRKLRILHLLPFFGCLTRSTTYTNPPHSKFPLPTSIWQLLSLIAFFLSWKESKPGLEKIEFFHAWAFLTSPPQFLSYIPFTYQNQYLDSTRTIFFFHFVLSPDITFLLTLSHFLLHIYRCIQYCFFFKKSGRTHWKEEYQVPALTWPLLLFTKGWLLLVGSGAFELVWVVLSGYVWPRSFL